MCVGHLGFCNLFSQFVFKIGFLHFVVALVHVLASVFVFLVDICLHFVFACVSAFSACSLLFFLFSHTGKTDARQFFFFCDPELGPKSQFPTFATIISNQ